MFHAYVYISDFGEYANYCIIRHSLRYFRYSGLVIYKGKLPVPSISMPCESRILQCSTKEQVKLVLLETAQRSLYRTLGEELVQGFKTNQTLSPVPLH